MHPKFVFIRFIYLMSKIHITDVIKSLEYGKLKKAGVLPKDSYFTKIPRLGGSFPTSLSRRVEPWWFGYFLDRFIHLAIANPNPELALSLCKKAHDSTSVHAGARSISYEDYEKECEYFKKIISFVISNLNFGDYKAEPTLESEYVQGHPDILVSDTIYDIKATGRFGKMRIDLVMQLLGYVALARREGFVINRIGAVLPAQNLVDIYDISGWDSSMFLTVLEEHARKLQKIRLAEPDDVARYFSFLPAIGSHVSRESTLLKTVSRYEHPIQIFLGSRLNAKFKFSDKDVANARKHIVSEKKDVFVHAPYSINLARSYDDDWVVTALCSQLELLSKVGGKGVVVHIGTKSDMEEEDAYLNMHINVSVAAESASVECPLLIETDAGGSLMDDPSELADFVLNLPDEVRGKVGVCVDTCHVFAAGYDPLETLQMFKDKCVRVHLIHYNDSQFEKGLKKDRHAGIGKGLIGLTNLMNVAEFAVNTGIPMVQE